MDPASFKKYSKLVIKQKFIEDWIQNVNDIENNPIMRTYRFIKKDFYTEPYLIKVSNYKYRHSITKLRTSSHDLMIEKGRHQANRLPIEQRLCKICNVVEDEAHFLLSCNLFISERQRLYNSLNLQEVACNRDNSELMLCLLGTNDQRHLELVGQFIYTCFQKRRVYIENTE